MAQRPPSSAKRPERPESALLFTLRGTGQARSRQRPLAPTAYPRPWGIPLRDAAKALDVRENRAHVRPYGALWPDVIAME